MRKYYHQLLFFLFVCTFSLPIFSQRDFTFFGNNEDKVEVKFQLVNNLIVFPIEINGKQLEFILDTGVNKSILFSLYDTDSLELKNIDRVSLRGLGSGEPVDAIRSRNNTFKIKNLISRGEELFVVTEDKFSLSTKMGLTIHGIIGYNLLKDVILRINYSTKRLTFYNPNTFKYSTCKKCKDFSLTMFNNKPYIDATVKIDDSLEDVKMKLLIDSGGSDALWIFEDDEKNIKTPDNYYNDILGEGLSGVIYGKRSRIDNISFGNFSLEKPTVSFLDSVSTSNARSYKERGGSIGGGVLKRFHVWIDYKHLKVRLKKNSHFSDNFDYNMSGMAVSYYGKELVKIEEEPKVVSYNTERQSEGNNVISLVRSFKYVFKPSYEVTDVVKDSPAGIAGVQKGDVLLSINNKKAYELTLQELNGLLRKKNGKKIWIKVRRGEEILKFKFELRRIL